VGVIPALVSNNASTTFSFNPLNQTSVNSSMTCFIREFKVFSLLLRQDVSFKMFRNVLALSTNGLSSY